MIHPSYVELMKVVNEGTDVGEEPVVNSRYSIVCATAKRARQLIDGKRPLIDPRPKEKPLSVAVNELYTGQLRILTDDEASDMALKEAELKEQVAERLREAKAAAEASKKEEEAAALADEPDEEAEAEDIDGTPDNTSDDQENNE